MTLVTRNGLVLFRTGSCFSPVSVGFTGGHTPADERRLPTVVSTVCEHSARTRARAGARGREAPMFRGRPPCAVHSRCAAGAVAHEF